ncbi:hypothetical protein TNCV_4287631 [Trichonephila clavipes]|uniref:Uncharacterized protein n=1 Tax=Trichonephila clavipes TaxID=2585209 RepID=A0A8X6SEN1_TRICX|nr:hypothetical protein TNCV_4287631 [Trichonephila clavipes]
MSYDYTACKRSLKCLFDLDVLGKILSWYRFASSELRCLPLGRKLDVKITCGDWYPSTGHSTKTSFRGCTSLGQNICVKPIQETALVIPHLFLLRHPDGCQSQRFIEAKEVVGAAVPERIPKNQLRCPLKDGVCGSDAPVIDLEMPAKGVTGTAAPGRRSSKNLRSFCSDLLSSERL